MEIIERENTRAAYEEIPSNRTDLTPGDWPIPQSPFKTPDALAKAMSKLTGEKWGYNPLGWVGGRGNCPSIENYIESAIYIWRDASGGWHPEHKVGESWLPDLDLLDKLIESSKLQKFDSEPACGNYTADEVAYMRHPD